MTRPKSIILFERFFWASFAVGLVGAVVGRADILAAYQRDPNVAAIGIGNGFLIATWCISFGVQLLFWYMIARRGSNVARWLCTILKAFAILSYLALIDNPSLPGGIARAFGLGSHALGAVAVILLFRRDAGPWFSNNGRVDPRAFD